MKIGKEYESREEFIKLAKPLIEWLNDNRNAHTKIIITPTSAEIVEGVMSIETFEFVKD